MAAFGRILDLFDSGQLRVQDVRENVKPFPVLIPQEDYGRDILVYRLTQSHDVWVGLFQHITDQHARRTGKETWSWLIQWESSPAKDHDGPPLAKKSRKGGYRMKYNLHSLFGLTPAPKATGLLPKPKTITMSVDPRRFDPTLLENREILRCLLEIVQCDSKVLPNYVEELYRLLDQYKRSGYALECAVLKEIPSLWLFEGHPVPLAKTTKQREDQTEIHSSKEQSQRLQYGEVKQGIQWPINKMSSQKFNLPTDPQKWAAYYWACWTCRKLAIALLLEAGIKMKQIQNYKAAEVADPKETSEEGSGSGLDWYYHDRPFAQKQEIRNKKRAANLKKYTETLISRRLNVEAEKAVEDAAIQDGNGGPLSTEHPLLPPPLIPPTPRDVDSGFPSDSSVKADNILHLRPTPFLRIDTIKIPDILSGKLKSIRFRNAKSVSGLDWKWKGAEELDLPARDALAFPLSSFIFDEEEEEYDDGEMGDLEEDGEEDLDEEDENEDEEGEDDGEDEDEDGDGIGEDEDDDGQEDEDEYGDENIAPAPTVMNPFAPMQMAPVPTGLNALAPMHMVPAPPAANPFVPMPMAPALNVTHPFGPMPMTRDRPSTNQEILDYLVTMSGEEAINLMHQVQNIWSNQGGPSAMLNNPSQGIQRDQRPSNLLPTGEATLNPLRHEEVATRGIPILLYYPQVLLPAENQEQLHDAVMLGYLTPGGTTLDVRMAIFLSIDISDWLVRQVRNNNAAVIERYGINFIPRMRDDNTPVLASRPHIAAYEKLAAAYSLMTSVDDREEDLTKRWRATKGPMRRRDRGAVWEGYGIRIDQVVEIKGGQRKTGIVFRDMGGLLGDRWDSRRWLINRWIESEENGEEVDWGWGTGDEDVEMGDA
ncbi:hypothetical protein P154DRAFT_585230 [Amniculicola lignicola CBS 123094]|uniref:Uncharacterized protein n=1 Tax=Amniculicola lignicola CBS 123094 TaxID=1392246 RepID=A0A6A5WVG0_9PLEO|nr:hypothetical protein P154DRAFT_585230 [Amniculicola lignicola CBS 123094]